MSGQSLSIERSVRRSHFSMLKKITEYVILAHIFILCLLISTKKIVCKSIFGFYLSNLRKKEVHMVLKQYVL